MPVRPRRLKHARLDIWSVDRVEGGAEREATRRIEPEGHEATLAIASFQSSIMYSWMECRGCSGVPVPVPVPHRYGGPRLTRCHASDGRMPASVTLVTAESEVHFGA